MAKFRKKPVVVEAFQWLGEEVPGFERICVGKDELSGDHYNLEIPTPAGTTYVAEGDWIITDASGWHYPCKPHVFAATYEPVES